VFDFDTDVAVRMHNLEADNELLPKYISTLQRLQNNDGKTATLQDEIEAEKDEKPRRNDGNFTQRIRAIAISVRCAIQELKQALDRIENPVEQTISSEKSIEIKGRKELIFSTMTQEQQNSACASCSHAKLSIQSETSTPKNQSENLKFECLSGTNKEMVFACTKFTDE
ncbi:hypothetical protein, partial [Vibrio parahaemolyticus]|uniref:hypothetical protein n=1 Tax=Vibrio parahaemolyticus TaxID=670 RepID=UPI00192A38A4